MIELKKTIDVGYDDGRPVRFLSGALFTHAEPVLIDNAIYLFIASKSLAPMVVEADSYIDFLINIRGSSEPFFWTPYVKQQINEIKDVKVLGESVLVNNTLRIHKHSDKSAFLLAEALKKLVERYKPLDKIQK